jgi:hypothetical protein
MRTVHVVVLELPVAIQNPQVLTAGAQEHVNMCVRIVYMHMYMQVGIYVYIHAFTPKCVLSLSLHLCA